MQIQDDRTEAQKATHCVLVVGTDRFLSGWGKASGGVSYAAWACRVDDESRVLRWVESRKDLNRVRVVGKDWRPRGNGHTHIYVVDADHPALAD